MAYFRCKGLAKAKAVTSFSVTSWTSLVGCAYWDAPSSMFDGVRVMYKTNSYPTSENDGTLFYEGAGSSLQLTYDTTVTGATKVGFSDNTTYYFSCFSYYLVNGVKKYNTSQYVTAQWLAQTISGSKGFTTTEDWPIPTGVRSIHAYAVGGGGGGGGGAHDCNTCDIYHGGGGGAGAYRGETSGNISVLPGQIIHVTIASGGAPQGSGGTTWVGDFLAVGGGGGGGSEYGRGVGGSGGTGGGGGDSWDGNNSFSGGSGGSNGSNGNGEKKGTGDRLTKYIGSTLFCGGGGGGRNSGGWQTRSGYYGGAGNGANGGYAVLTDYRPYWGTNGSSATANTGGGGGGGGGDSDRQVNWWATSGGWGGSGYALITY